MKKLLSLIGALTLTASASSVLISCSDKDTDKYGNTFINGDGSLKITTEDLLNWYNETYGSLGKNPQKFLAQFYNIFAVAIYEEASREENNIFENLKTTNSQYLNQDGKEFAESLKNAYGKESKATGTIYGNANSAMVNERKGYLDDKSKGTKAWVKYLRNEFPWVDNDQTSLENAWISNYILTDSSNSAYANLANTLGFGASQSTWYQGYSSIIVNDTTISGLMSSFIRLCGDIQINQETKTTKIYQTPGISENQEIAIINLINALGGKNAFITTTTETFKIEFITSLEDNAFKNLTWNDFLQGISSRYRRDSNSFTGTIASLSSSHSLFDLADVQALRLDSYGTKYEKFWNHEGKQGTNLNRTNIVSVAPNLNSTNSQESKDIWNKYGTKQNVLSNSQRFLVDKYFEEKAPVATSQVVLSFSAINASATPDTLSEISPAQFVNPDWTSVQTQQFFIGFDRYYNEYVKSGTSSTQYDIKTSNNSSAAAGLSDFETFYRGANSRNSNLWKLGDEQSYIKPYLTATKNEQLLTKDFDTTSGTYSNLAKFSVYDFLANGGEAKNSSVNSKADSWTNENTNIKDIATFNAKIGNNDQAKKGVDTLFELVNTLGRHANDTDSNVKPYEVVNEEEGIIAFIDTDGLHFLKIDGYQTLKASSNQKNSYSTKRSEENDKKQSLAYDTLVNTNKELIPYLLNPKSIQGSYNLKEETTVGTNADIDKINIINGMADEFKTEYSEILNYSIENDYERFLVNNSIAKNALSSESDSSNLFYNFDIVSDAQASITSTESFGLLGQWIWLYMDEIFGTNGNYYELYKKFFEVEGENINEDGIRDLLDYIEATQNAVENLNQTFKTQNWNWIKSTEDNYKKQMAAASVNSVQQSFIPKYALEVNSSIFNEITYWKTPLSDEAKTNYIFKSVKYLEDAVIYNLNIKHKEGVE
ncbi:hypothetical protein CK556_01375 [Mesoplasma chauliocola]|uniref:Lipoprotein n=1 Tax=Mesoplasma chauliocola TaxID=216427 RepID=A0A249SMY3_9MOLU|nr:lipoprotein [Mesoplasma chauliocola]ASZ09006.1 hypothetical protein CK556_01375 [Mesoplasma chauliocola]